MIPRSMALISVLLCAAGVVGAQLPRPLIREDYDPGKTLTRMRFTPLFDQVPPSGYLPVRIFIHNGFRTMRKWDFDFVSTCQDYSDRGNELRSGHSVTCDPGQTLEYDILVPLVTAFQSYHGNAASLEVRAGATALRSSLANHATEFDPRWPSVMISESLYTANRGPLSSAVNSRLASPARGHHRYHYGGGATNLEFGAAFNPGHLPEDWRGYTGFDCCLMTGRDWNSLAPGARDALLKWNRLGGNLLIYTRSPAADTATLNLNPSGRGETELIRSWGEVRILDLPATGLLDPASTVRLIADDLPPRTGGNKSSSYHHDFHAGWPLRDAFGSRQAHILFFILVLIAFGILVGPVNLFVFARSGQRHRLFITTPVISLGASLLLVVLILFQDGFGGRGERLVLMEVRSDPRENAAYLAQEQIARTGVLLSTRFKTSEPATLSPVLIEESHWARVTRENSGGDGRFTLDLRNEGFAAGGDWFQSRSEHGHYLETVRPTRGRIEALPGAATPVVTSTFEFPLDTLYLKDARGNYWTARNVRQGRRVTLAGVPSTRFHSWLAAEKKRFNARNKKRLSLAAQRSACFFAATSEAPAIDTLRSVNWTRTHAVLTGEITTP